MANGHDSPPDCLDQSSESKSSRSASDSDDSDNYSIYSKKSKKDRKTGQKVTITQERKRRQSCAVTTKTSKFEDGKSKVKRGMTDKDKEEGEEEMDEGQEAGEDEMNENII